MCTKVNNVFIFHTVYHRPSERLTNACFEPLLGSLTLPLAQLQDSVENFLLVVWTCYRYGKVFSGNKLSNAPTLVIVRRLHRSPTSLVQKCKSTTKKRPPLSDDRFQMGIFLLGSKKREILITPKLKIVWPRQIYEKASIFHDLFENDTYLSKSFN